MNTDLLVVGAGPAGLAAAVEAAGLGYSVTLVDENAGPGGRIWQALETRGAAEPEDQVGLALMRRLRASEVTQARNGAIETHWNTAVWAIEPGGVAFLSGQGVTRSLSARTILLATGAMERPMPIAGWTLPGVMTIGAAQIALKTGGLIPDRRTWLAGQGPLLLLYARQVLDAGGSIAGIIDLSDGFAPVRALGRMSLAALPDIARGLAWRRRLAAAGVRWIAASDLRAEGDEALSYVAFRTASGWQREEADLLLLHDGVIPSVQMSRALGCRHKWNEVQRCWYPATDEWGATSVPNVLVAGDGAGIAGAAAGMLSGRIAVLGLRVETRAEAARLRAERERLLAVRPVLDTLFAPHPVRLNDSTLVCRCEEVSAGEVRNAARHGCLGMNQLKAYTRCGMGPCQGRTCGPVATEVLAEALGQPVPAIEPLRTRFPTKPVSVGDLVSLPADG